MTREQSTTTCDPDSFEWMRVGNMVTLLDLRPGGGVVFAVPAAELTTSEGRQRVAWAMSAKGWTTEACLLGLLDLTIAEVGTARPGGF